MSKTPSCVTCKILQKCPILKKNRGKCVINGKTYDYCNQWEPSL